MSNKELYFCIMDSISRCTCLSHRHVRMASAIYKAAFVILIYAGNAMLYLHKSYRYTVLSLHLGRWDYFRHRSRWNASILHCHQALPLYLRNSISPDCPFSLITCVSLLEYIMLSSNWHLAKKQVVHTSFPIICSDMSDWSTYQMHLYESLSRSCRSRSKCKVNWTTNDFIIIIKKCCSLPRNNGWYWRLWVSLIAYKHRLCLWMANNTTRAFSRLSNVFKSG